MVIIIYSELVSVPEEAIVVSVVLHDCREVHHVSDHDVL